VNRGRPAERRQAAGALVLALLTLAACTGSGSSGSPTPGISITPAAPSPGPTLRPTASASSPTQHTPTVTEPTTTNTLPPPPQPSKPAPSTAGQLTAKSLPIPQGWRTIARRGGSEEGYQGNGTWVHARDPRYAAQDVITLGCQSITRDDYTDPIAALEGSYQKKGIPGIGLVLQFGSRQAASRFYALYTEQVAACTNPGGPVLTKIISSKLGLIDRRTYPDGDWTEVGALKVDRLTLIILSDPGHKITQSSSEGLLRQIVSG
jgi:hypothetical protein